MEIFFKNVTSTQNIVKLLQEENESEAAQLVEGSIGDFCDFVAGLFESLDPKRGRKKDRVIWLVLQHLLPLLERAWRFGTLALGAETRAI